MAKIDLSGYNLSQLKGLQHDIEVEIKNRQHRDLQRARGQILAIAQEAGVSVEELLATDGKKPKINKGKKVQVRYQNPADLSQTWAGRGRKPKWIAEGLASGNSMDDFRI
jgi:DNA-binding protein H-NS